MQRPNRPSPAVGRSALYGLAALLSCIFSPAFADTYTQTRYPIVDIYQHSATSIPLMGSLASAAANAFGRLLDFLSGG